MLIKRGPVYIINIFQIWNNNKKNNTQKQQTRFTLEITHMDKWCNLEEHLFCDSHSNLNSP